MAPTPSGGPVPGARRLPPGQRSARLERFGLPRYAPRRPRPPERPEITVAGAVSRPLALPVDGLLGTERRALRADLHCVTTWSALDLLWEGVPFRRVHAVLAAEAGVDPRVRWVTVTGLDGYRACLYLDDALAGDVLLADRLDGAPLGADHGAPLRLVAPAHYGYMSVKHVRAIEYRRTYAASPAGWAVHPRGRTRLEERSRYLPGPFWRPVWRSLVPMTRRAYRRHRP
ncbi:molybdopterin-dependent oxidoreductase [Nocardiopsis halophila]|uniref:molybdopterin-dependent oxidoreductase n=1 Tax=Nocardiopsis halophila TaxID=141692 RepID=UPI000345D6C9|nr:molybdopterin-dependent oxidoreductase [Nocardiopsis halophila]